MIYSVILASCGNPDHGENPYEPVGDALYEKVYTASIEECRCRVLEYILFHNLGSGNWCGGQVYDGMGNYIGQIAYNGTFIEKT